MSRCRGWTSAAVEAVRKKNGGVCVTDVPTKKVKPNKHRDYEGELSAALTALGVEHERNYRFLKDRRFRFDFAFPDRMIAIEFEGGIYSNGRHVRPGGYDRDCKKYTLAARAGWELWRYTTNDVKGDMGVFALAVSIKEELAACG
jgi:very-short-patch-repair endonuclease